MNLGLGLSFGIFARPVNAAPTQAQVNQQVAQGGGSDLARDRVVRDNRKAAAARLVGSKLATQKIVVAEGKVGQAKKR